MLRTQPATVAVEQARELVHVRLDEWSITGVQEAVAAVAVELVANAVRHARTACELRLWHDGTHVVVEVRDHDDRLSKVAPTAPQDDGGRGLHIVDAFSSSWGVATVPGGKVVWAYIDLPFQ